jgi:parvulin-like peptidyl-prolyl isomerase
VARVGSTEITRDQWVARVKVDDYDLSLFEARVREQAGRGDISKDTMAAYQQAIDQRRQQLPSVAIEELIDEALQAQLAPSLGVSVSAAEIDAQIAQQANTPEQRHVLVIAVDPLLVDKTADPSATASPTASPSPTPSPSPSGSPTTTASPTASPSASPEPTNATPDQIARARARAQSALDRLLEGRDFADIAVQYSTDPSGPRGGDLGFLTLEGVPDEDLGAQLFALAPGATSGVIEGAKHIMWVARVTEIRPASQDPHFLDGLSASGVDAAAYRAARAADALRTKMSDALIAQVTAGPTDQVHAYHIQVALNPSAPTSTDDEVHVLHILYSPGDDPNKAETADDAAWAAAEAEATKAADALRGLTDVAFRRSQFEATARTVSDDSSSGGQGGDIGWTTRALLERPFGDAIFDGQHNADEIIGPLKTRFGWHVIYYLGRRVGAPARMNAIRDEVTAPGADFAEIARQKSEGSDASSGGDMGWIARHQLSVAVEDIVFGLQAGQVSAVITDTNGLNLYFAKEREQRDVDDDQLATLKASAFSNWYDPQKTAADIWRDVDVLGQTTSTS